MANPWDKDPVVDPFEDALKAEGLTGQAASIARSIYQQESSSGKNTKTSNAGAVGGMQIIPATFKSVADKDWDINDPTQNARAGIRYVKQLFEQAGGDPALTAAGYYGGPGGLEKARRGVAVSDPRNPNAPNTLQYGEQVAARLPKEKGLIQRGVEAVIPSASAATGNPWDNDPIVDEPAAKATELGGAAFGVYPNARRNPKNNTPNASDAIVMGIARGVKDPIDTGAALLSRVAGPEEAARVQAMNDKGKQEFKDEYGGSSLAGASRIAGNVAATLPVGGILGAPLKALAPAGSVANRLGSALASGGASTGAPIAQGLAPAATNMLLRMAGGAGTGAASAGLIDPTATSLGAGIGAFLPPAARLVGAAANTAGSLARPFTSAGQQKIAGDVLREFTTDPTAARAALLQAREIVPGSAPTAATASGDAGIAAVTRSMQGSSPSFAADMAARQTAQNQARSTALEGIAGNTGKIEIAERARDAATGAMREEALRAAGKVPAQGILQQIDNLIADPNNAGQLSQQALNQFKSRIAANVKDGAVDARALYAIRKDINDVLSGKLQGEAGNLRYAASQLSGVKGFIDDAIDQASRSMPANAIGPTTRGTPDWKGYLRKYSQESVPIDQMKRLEGILKVIQTNTVDSQGGAIISAAKLNNILKNQGGDLVKELSPQQLQILRNIQADLNANQIAANVGKAGRSDTFQNFAQNQLLDNALGRTLGGSTASTSTLGRMLQLPYGAANTQIQERLANALLNPQEAAALLTAPKNNALLQALTQSTLPYKAAPVISAR